MRKYAATTKRGCPTCSGLDPKTCSRCMGKTRQCDWYDTTIGWAHISQLTAAELEGKK